MNSQQSRPPKERVNIVYRAGTDGQVDEKELPLKMLVMGDFTQREDTTPIGERRAVRVDGNNFDAVMAEHKLSLDICVQAPPSEHGPAKSHNEAHVHLDVRTLRDLTPEGICQQVPHLQRLLQLRQALLALKGPLGNIPAFRKKMQAMLRDHETRKQLAQDLGVDLNNA